MDSPLENPRSASRLRHRLRRLGRLLRWILLGAAAIGLLALVLFTVWLNLAPDRGYDVLLITIDTQRIDRLGCYGTTPGNSPNLDRLASRGVLFEQVVVSIPRTTQNLATLMTGLEPREHGVRELMDGLPDDVATLAESLDDRGYRTGAFVGGGPLGRDQNLYQGFDHAEVHAYDDQEQALKMVSSAGAWITRHASGPWFAWVHLYDPHFFYAPPWPFWARSHAETPAVDRLYQDLWEGRRSFGSVHFDNDLNDARRRYLAELYSSEVRATDFSVGWLLRLVRLLERLDPGRRTLIVVTADHGESLGEHAYWYNHGNFLYDEDLLVPLLIILPGILPEGTRVRSQVRTLDIFPTMLELLGDPVPAGLKGRSLLPLIQGKEEDHRLAFTEGDSNRFRQNRRFYYEDGILGRWRCVRDGRYKLIRIPRPEGDRFELYDLDQDPGETRNLAGTEGETLARLRTLLEAWESEPPGRAEPIRDAPSPEELERLRALGYVD